MIIPEDEQCLELYVDDCTDNHGAAIKISEFGEIPDCIVISRKQAPLVIEAIQKWMRGEDIG